MPFPKQKTTRDRKTSAQALAGLEPKKQEDFPLFMCEFFEGFDVLQTQGIESGEYIFGLYFSGKYCGHVYFGDRWTHADAARICADIMPASWQQVHDYVKEKGHKVWYHKMAPSQYAWVYEKVITKTT